MPVWAWIVTGAAGLLVLSAVAGLAVAAVLGSISRDVTELLDLDVSTAAPVKRVKTPVARV